MNAKPTYGLIGRGRVATHMARYLELENQPVVGWNRGDASSPGAALAGCDVVLLAVSDDAVGPFVDQHPDLTTKSCVHFSASLAIDGIHGIHPLMTFGPEVYELETYRAIPFVEEAEGAGFRTLFPALSNPVWPLSREQRPLYHALCVLAGNLSSLLWCKAMHEFEHRLGLPPEVLHPFLEQTCRNTLLQGSDAVTGPLVRGDRETVARDLAALGSDPYAEVFRAFASIYNLEGVTV